MPHTANNLRRRLSTVLKEIGNDSSHEITRMHYLEPETKVNPRSAQILDELLSPGSSQIVADKAERRGREAA